MKIFISYSIVIFYFVIAFPLFDFCVITSFEEKTLERYFFLLQNKTSNKFLSTNQMFNETTLAIVCHELRQARIFQITSGKEKWDWESSKISRNISSELLEREFDNMEFKQKPALRVGNTKVINITSFNCMDHHGDFDWFITTGFMPNSSFLFTLKPDHFHVFSREVHGPEKREEIIPKLAAIIDEYTEQIIPEDVYNMSHSQLLSESFNIANEELNGMEKLCRIPQILKMRLCSIATNVVFEDDLNVTELNGGPITYRILSSNFHVQPSFPGSDCPFAYLRFDDGIFIKKKFLLCGTQMENEFRIVYLGLNLLNEEEAFIVHVFTNHVRVSVSEFLLFKVPLLKHLDDYIEILKDEDI